jgi:N-methylhydantoinase A/oxoprolinase/acetone carboxylase beta subunit
MPLTANGTSSRRTYFKGTGWCDSPVIPIAALVPDHRQTGPAIVDCEYTTVTINPGAIFWISAKGNLLVDTTSVVDII